MTDIDRIAARPAAYLAETGVPQLTGGLIFFIMGSAVLIQQRLLPRTFLYMEGMQYGAIFCIIAISWGITALKRRMVFPRGGYVETRGRSSLLLSFAVFALIAVAIGVFEFASPLNGKDLLNSALLWPGFAVLFALICLHGGWKKKSAPMICFGVYMALLAPLLWWLPVTSYERSACLQIAAGAPLGIAGAIRLRCFLKINPLAPEPTNE